MPIYEYVCRGCQHRFEIKQRFSDAPLSTCARCGDAVTKVISAPAIMFKGNGWYVTDYSDKLKAPEQPTAQKPGNERADQKPAATSSESAPSSGTAGSDSAGPAKTSTQPPAASASSSSGSTNTSSTGKPTD